MQTCRCTRRFRILGRCFGVAPLTICWWNSLRYWNQNDVLRPRASIREITEIIFAIHVEKPPLFSFLRVSCLNHEFFNFSIFLDQGKSRTQQFALPDRRGQKSTPARDDLFMSAYQKFTKNQVK